MRPQFAAEGTRKRISVEDTSDNSVRIEISALGLFYVLLDCLVLLIGAIIVFMVITPAYNLNTWIASPVVVALIWLLMASFHFIVRLPGATEQETIAVSTDGVVLARKTCFSTKTMKFDISDIDDLTVVTTWAKGNAAELLAKHSGFLASARWPQACLRYKGKEVFFAGACSPTEVKAIVAYMRDFIFFVRQQDASCSSGGPCHGADGP